MIYRAARSMVLGLQNAQDTAEGQDKVEWSLSAKLHWSVQLFERTGWRAQNGFEEHKVGKSCYPLPL